MAEIIRIKDSTLLNQQKYSSCNSLKFFVIVKLLGDNKTIEELKIVKNHLNNLIDEPVVFIIKNNDYKTKEFFKLLNYPYETMDLNKIRLLDKNNTMFLFVISGFKMKFQQIMEIVCNKKFSKSILLV